MNMLAHTASYWSAPDPTSLHSVERRPAVYASPQSKHLRHPCISAHVGHVVLRLGGHVQASFALHLHVHLLRPSEQI